MKFDDFYPHPDTMLSDPDDMTLKISTTDKIKRKISVHIKRNKITKLLIKDIAKRNGSNLY
jgi:hypothetical protein